MAVFILWAGGWVIVRQVAGGGSWWGPLHVFLVGAVLLAISGASQLFSITWAAVRPPGRRIVTTQRWATAIGAALSVVGVSNAWDGVTIIGAFCLASGLVLLGVVLVSAFRRSLLRRFGLSGRFYLLALGSGVVGVVLGAILGVGGFSGLDHLDARTAHMHLNLIGLVGFTIFGTLPALLPTTASHPMVSGREAVVAFWMALAASAAMASGIVLGPEVVGVGVTLAAVSGLSILVGIVSRLGPRRMLGSGLPGLLITSGMVWILGWCAHQAVVLIDGTHVVFSGATALGAGGVALVLFGSLAYLVPVLVGAAAISGDAVPILHRGALVRVLAANGALLAAALGLAGGVVVATAAIWVLDFGVRVVRSARS